MRDEQISRMLSERISAGDFPSAVYLASESGEVVLSDALGDAVKDGKLEHATTLDTIYDLASLTKPLVTGLLSARRLEQGEIKLNETAAHYLPEFERPDKRGITLRHLLTHTSGLPAWRPLYLSAEGDKQRVLEVIASETLESQPGTQVRYSDLGFITLGLLLESISNASLADIARREIFEPLTLRRTFFNPDKALVTEMAACEIGNFYERGMCDEKQAEAYAWREGLIWGEVHDGNAYFLGGAAGHAGLFSTVRETLRIASQFHARLSELFKAETCALFRTNLTEGLNEARSFAWQLALTADSTTGTPLPPDSFGHLGFTGTSCWNDPRRERTYILLTNRTHARKLPFVNINSVRRQFHTLAAGALDHGDAATRRRGDAATD